MTNVQEGDIIKIIEDALNCKEQRVTIDSTMDDFEQWDSLGHLGILAALDTFFEGKVGDIQEIGNARSVREILQILRGHGLM